MIKFSVKGPKEAPVPATREGFAEDVRSLAVDEAGITAMRLTSALHAAVPKLSSNGVLEDAAHIQFVASDRPPTLVGATQVNVAEVHVEDRPTSSGRPADLVVRTIEFGSQTLQVPATGFARAVMGARQAETQRAAEGLLQSADASR